MGGHSGTGPRGEHICEVRCLISQGHPRDYCAEALLQLGV